MCLLIHKLLVIRDKVDKNFRASLFTHSIQFKSSIPHRIGIIKPNESLNARNLIGRGGYKPKERILWDGKALIWSLSLDCSAL